MKIAIIGNGPISYYQRKIIEGYDIVVRFNGMKNWKEPQKKTIIAIRQHESGFFGLDKSCTHLTNTHINKLILIGTNRINNMKKICTNKNIDVETIHVYNDKYFYPNINKNYMNKFKNDSFSSGFIIINYFLHKYPNANIHIFGMNWNLPKGFHHMVFEKKEINELSKKYNIKIYKTPKISYLP